MLKVRSINKLCRWHNIWCHSVTSSTRYTHVHASNIRKGTEVEGFVVDAVEDVPELFLSAVKLTHKKTKAKYLHIARDDSNNVFSIGFRTTPMDSTGVPHILEHTTLCGSQKYPCRDPFFKMLNRSMSTFMNAMTGPDYTIYPFSSQNEQDYENLMSVYLDAVFRPKLRELDFMQEGWRLEHSDVKNEKSPIIIKGVVFNEMKGVFSDPQQLFGQHLINNLLPSHTYGVVSGGDPTKIPELTWRDLKNFHSHHYHPSNARFYSYGNFDLEKHLKFVDDNYLTHYDYKAIDTSVPCQPKWTEPRRKHVESRFDPMSPDPQKQGTLSVSFLMSDITNTYESFVLQMLSELLIDGPNAPFYKSLIEPNIACGFSPVSGFDAHTRDTTFTVGLQGVSEQDFDRAISIVRSTLESVAKEGFPKDRVEAILHRVELAIKHQSPNFGLGLLFNLTPLWNHDGDVIGALKIAKILDAFRREEPLFLSKKIQEYFLDNTHQLVLTMLPSEKFETDLKTSEEAVLQTKLSRLSEAHKSEIIKQGQELLDEQSKMVDTSCLPMLHISDLKSDVERTAVTESKINNVPLQLSIQPTNGIAYFRGILNISDLPVEHKALLPLFCTVVTQMGTKRYSFREFDQLVSLKTGGLQFKPHVAASVDDVNRFEQGILFSSYCLNRNVSDMFELFQELLMDVTFHDMNRFETLVKETATDMVNGLTHIGHHYCMTKAAGLLSPADELKELFGGLTYINRLKEIAQMSDLSDIVQKMQDICKRVFNKHHLRCSLNLSPGSELDTLKSLEKFVQTLPGDSRGSSIHTVASGFKPMSEKIHFVLPLNVHFTSCALPAVPFSNPDFARLRILSKLLTSQFLHREIREKGGAYGSGAHVGSGGVLSFFSYRDPNRSSTFSTFDKAVDWLHQLNFTDQHVEEAKLGVFQQVDSPIAPGNRGMNLFLNGISDDMLQAHRRELFNVDKQDLLHVGNKYLKHAEHVGRVCMGPSDNGNKSDGWNAVSL